ncbi:hypothetical protein GCM10018793_32030 [Streptomyces sulfonofaciens]|uniref:Secreted protein n=1 Tax=Streptomyces sulfonofaciens TaxID=68272 RepID=A0A919G7Q6_9ACTN|nr:hypothetical protein [Streptomyces sulfonofaciens]GHH79386.1 hypothetical protein GCM10018793_32030 [Streptomyces sulfonofaciens]
MRTHRGNGGARRAVAAALLGLGAALGPVAVPALADTSPSPAESGSSSQDAAPTEAGTSFRTAAAIRQDQQATASASTGDYLYWSFPADSGQRPTVRATVRLPPASARHADTTWQIDVYDGLRRRQACMYGAQTRTAAPGTGSLELACTLRPVRAWSEPWADDPLPGTYYVRLTAVGLGAADVGQPVQVSVEALSHDVGGAHAVGGGLSEPLVPGVSVSTDDSGTAALSKGEPDGGWSSGWWTDRWLWTAAGGILASLAGIAGYALTRGRGRPYSVPPRV